MTTNTTTATTKAGNLDDQEYYGYLNCFAQRAAARIADNVVFTTDAHNLWEIYLDSFPAEQRQFHNCKACQHFIETYGSLVVLNDSGQQTTLLWEIGDTEDLTLRLAIARMCKVVENAKVTGVFLSSEKIWGTPVTKIWRHLSVNNPKVFTHPLYAAHQVAAEKKTEYATVSKCLSEFTLDQLEEAVRILQANALDRTEKVLGQAVWLRDLKNFTGKGNVFRNRVWLAVATAPSGFCHPRSSMISTLLDDLAAGMSFEDVSARWTKKMHPLRYQRPTAPPKDGAIAQAEETVAKLGTAGSLARRFALLADVPMRLWTPTPPAGPVAPGGTVFEHLRATTQSPAVTLPEQCVTWEKLAATVLPTADQILFHVPLRSQNYGVFTAPVNPDAPPIFQWDSTERRNALAWYVWHGGSPASQFGLTRDTWVNVVAITEKPPHFYDTLITHYNRGIMLVLEGAKDTRNSGSGLFPECLRSEYHGIRATIEAFSSLATVEEAGPGQLAQGLILDQNHEWMTLVKAITKGKAALYRLDRWN